MSNLPENPSTPPSTNPPSTPDEKLSSNSQLDFVIQLDQWIEGLLPKDWGAGSVTLIKASVLIFIALFFWYFFKVWITRAIRLAVKKTSFGWDDILVNDALLARLSRVVPSLVIYFGSSLFGIYQALIQRISLAFIIIVALSVITAASNAFVILYRKRDKSKNKPIKGYVQTFNLIASLFATILAIAALMDKDPSRLFLGLGGMTAILLLVFKDSILGLVASIQLTTNDMVRIGDWIEMPKYGADGDVVDINLHTVKVQNWDKTYSTIPAYALISGSFKNWRGMSASGGRRIKRSLHIDMSSIKFLDHQMLKKLENVDLIKDYLKSKEEELNSFHQSHPVSSDSLINGRRLTNIGTYRAYIEAYLKNNPKIERNGFTFLVRQLAPDDKGLPIEIYVFSNDINWVSYEGIQSDIFDHLLAALPEFDLKVFQNPTGGDFQKLFHS